MMMSWQTFLAIGSGGFLGAVTRAYLNGQINHHFPHSLPFGTLGVNLIGSFIIGVLFAYFSYTTLFGVHAKSFLTTGFLGALTTYSTFAMETVFLLSGGQIIMAATNMALNLFGSVLMAGLGYYLFRHFLA
jgi:CrcB protein